MQNIRSGAFITILQYWIMRKRIHPSKLKIIWINLEVVKQKGLDNVTVDDLVAEMVPKGRALVPDTVKKDLLQSIRTFLAEQSNL